jgi:LETM1-like protein
MTTRMIVHNNNSNHPTDQDRLELTASTSATTTTTSTAAAAAAASCTTTDRNTRMTPLVRQAIAAIDRKEVVPPTQRHGLYHTINRRATLCSYLKNHYHRSQQSSCNDHVTNCHTIVSRVLLLLLLLCTMMMLLLMLPNTNHFVLASPIVTVVSSSSNRLRISHRILDCRPQQQQQNPQYRRGSTTSSNALNAVHFTSTTTSAVPDRDILVHTTAGATLTPTKTNSNNNNNLFVALFGYVKNSIVRTATGCTQLYSNHQRCNTIRQKQAQYRSTVQEQWERDGINTHLSSKDVQKLLQTQVQNGITYEEYRFLQLGKEDRGKVLNLGFLMWGAPRVLPYALMFNKNMLPSPFSTTTTTTTTIMELSTYETMRRERTQAIINTLFNLEKQLHTIVPNGSGNFFTNLFTKRTTSKAATATGTPEQQQQEIIRSIVSEAGHIFRRGFMILPSTPSATTTTSQKSSSSTSAKSTASTVLQLCEPYLYRTSQDYTGLEQRLGHLPSCIVLGMGNAISGMGIPNLVTQITPAFFRRRKLLSHIDKITKEDDFLRSCTPLDLNSIPKRLLLEACQDRMIDFGIHTATTTELRNSLLDWLQLTQPIARPSCCIMPTSTTTATNPQLMEIAQTTNTVLPNQHSFHHHPPDPTSMITASTTTTTTATTTNTPSKESTMIYYNGNLARFILLAYNGCVAICDPQQDRTSTTVGGGSLPQLLYNSCTK